MMPRSPLGALSRNAQSTERPPSLSKSGQMKVDPRDELLFKAVARSPSYMADLGGPAMKADKATIPGGLALRAIGYDCDEAGNVTYDERRGIFNAKLLAAKEKAKGELLARMHSEKQLALLSQELHAWRNGSMHGQLLYQAARAHADAFATAEAAHANAMALQVTAMAAQRVELEQTISTCRAELAAAQESERAQVERCQQQLGTAIECLGRDLKETERAASRVRASQLIAERWRSRGRRAKDMAAYLKETLPLTDEWTREFRKLIGSRHVPPEQEGLRELWECQLRCLRSKSHRCRWHPKVLQWCADVWTRDRGAYEQMAFGKVLILPHPETIRKQCSRSIARPGHNDELYKSLGPEGATKGWTDGEREVFLKFDELNINTGLAWRQVIFFAPTNSPLCLSGLCPL